MNLPINEIFSSVQGEGSFTGTPAVFVRLQYCPVGCPWCFVPNTPILMGNGKYKRIDKIKVGDVVMSWDGEKFDSQPIIKLYKSIAKELIRIETDADGNRKITCTPEHPILTTDGWVEAGKLKIGDALVKWDVHARMKSHFNPQKVKPHVPSKKTRAKLSASMSNTWVNNPSMRQIVLDRMTNKNPMKDPKVAAKSWLARESSRKKTGLEKAVEKICAGLPIVYCGDGENFSVAHKFPDFRVEGQKKLIEVWAGDSLWAQRAKRDEVWIEKRRALFAKHGYETLFLPLAYHQISKDGAPKLREQIARFIHNGTKVTSVTKLTNKAYTRHYGTMSAPRVVYNLEVEKNHTYVADGFVVHNCDTKHTWEKEDKNKISFEEMLAKEKDASTWADVGTGRLIEYLVEQPEELIVITGGEPCFYDLTNLTSGLVVMGKQPQIETSGTIAIKAHEHTFITVSPKIDMPGGLQPLQAAIYMADEIKMPVGKMADVEKLKNLLSANMIGQNHMIDTLVYLQPLSQSERATELCIEQARLNGWRLSAQLHKYLKVR